ncbi:hypothetical protein BABINDRAFT_162229 [Babjeviella inositovora NRRL Y-12698]|uniref:Oligomycin resistance ATP-dependent permease YOR1 n=1 Tax=Babjeviella inositovora NRRL Y-12698 TaxID=984486 RepID=A0A1E3QQF4_9ASCO|nr:uncharacterized protein BABINDRAFT_162229 [Babjeviella inositovora NRRL Y-12698]ODQ79187.1 hypothetical protein BABINDRAFT_162229 [Babjeviella inositovora NRRL Y-12698]
MTKKLGPSSSNELADGKEKSSSLTSRDAENPEALQLQKRLLSWMMSNKVPPIPSEEERTAYPWKTDFFLKRVFFWWLNPVMKTGYKRTLVEADLWKLEGDLKIDEMYAQFKVNFERRIAAAEAKFNARAKKSDDDVFVVSNWQVVMSLFDTFRWQYISGCVYKVFSDVGLALNPLLMKELITFVGLRALGFDYVIGHGVGYAVGTSLIVLISGILINHFFHNSMLTGAQVKAVLTKALLDKSFKLDAQAKHDFPIGKITSLMGADLARIDFAIGFQPFVITFPVPVIICIALLIHNIGVSSLAGIGVFIFSSLGIAFVSKTLFAQRKLVGKFTDQRVGAMREILNSMKMIKYYAWEGAYEANVTKYRTREMNIVLKMQVLRNFIIAFAVSLPMITSLVAFLVMYGVGRTKNPADIFSSVSLFNALAQQMLMVPIALASGADGLVAIGRIKDYLLASEVSSEDRDASTVNQELDARDIAIEAKGASFKWETFAIEADEEDAEDEQKNRLARVKTSPDAASSVVSASASIHDAFNLTGDEKETGTHDVENSTFPGLIDLSFSIKKGEFVVVTGLIGTGKSSLLNALAGFMKCSTGTLESNGSLLLCGYPWVQNATVKENIVFGQEFKRKLYDQVIAACSLEADLEMLPAGDETEIGERGITLSGGQKARINLARAVYADTEIILLDDVLSAVDARVGKHIMDECMMGLLKHKTRILATHQLSLIGSADRIIFLNGDGSIQMGTSEELMANNPGFIKLMEFNSEAREEEEEEEAVLGDEVEQEAELIKLQTNVIETKKDGRLFSDEEKAVNRIGFHVYKAYVSLGAGFMKMGIVPAFITVAVCATFCQLFTNTWLSFWTSYKFKGRTDGFYIGFYVMFVVLSIIFICLEFAMLALLSNNAARKLNLMAVHKLLHTPMSFMDTTPMGRILNRFTKDTDALDNEMSEQVRLFFFPLSTIVGVLILCIIYLPWFAIAVPFLAFMFVGISGYYQASAREVKRLEAIQRSFVYNNFNETLGGMDTIKAYKMEHHFIEKNNRMIDNMNEAYYITIANQRWLAVHLDMIASLFALIVSLLCVTHVFKISASSSGLLVSYVMQIAGLLSLLIRAMTLVENEMNSVERLLHYATDLPQEAPYVLHERVPPPEWPSKGEIVFEHTSMAYRPGLPLVLKDVNFAVKPSEKIGICGRTGAGKSSIMTALYRLSELAEGKIVIDDLDISTLGLRDLRSKLSIIPQDPVLFHGSIRKNLDPFQEQSDELLWDALRRSGLIELADLDRVKGQVYAPDENGATGENGLHKFHLDQNVEDDGANFSLGERQLLSLARALVRGSKILILDEATSSVDYETDAKIQATIVNEFGHCTILCIAHRLKTILNYDRILVMDKGEIAEFDTPLDLFNAGGSIFRQMCDRSNIVALDF